MTNLSPFSRRSLGSSLATLGREQSAKAAYLGIGSALTWADYDVAAAALAVVFFRELGLRRGERVAILLPDGPDVHIALMACERAGVVAVGIGPRAGLGEIEHLLRLTRAVALVSRPEHQGRRVSKSVRSWQEQALPLSHHIEVTQNLRPANTVKINGLQSPPLVDGTGLPPERGFSPEEVSLLNSTSGTTGMPKCVAHDLARWQAFHELAVRHGDLGPEDVFMSLVPAPFGFGIWTSHVTPTLLGVPTVVMERFEATAALELIAEHRVSVLAAVSTQFILMLEVMDQADVDLSSLRVLFTGGEAVPYERAAAFENRTGAAVLQFYGSNETGAVSGTRIDDSREKRLKTAGRPIPEMRLRLFDETGSDVTHSGSGQPGCKGPTLSRGYFGDGPDVEAGNAELIRSDGWMLLGDRVTIDEDGYLSVIGRIDDFIIRGGKNISGPGVEAQVATHPAISLAAAIAMPDPIFGERVCVYVEVRQEHSAPSLEELTLHLQSRNISKESWPERIVVVESLPRGSGGKVAKQALREDIRRRLISEADG
ncbi:MAG: class I adenylate-forming enzyme family protein [Myxococcota bacterium]|nr:class I adenylate-forming enzyme family protein [Myxococcota bacterium]